jgi:hypothetical protein
MSFKTSGFVKIASTLDTFVDLAYTLPFAASGADAYISSLVTKTFSNTFEPKFFQIPYIYSAADNLINGKFILEIKVEDNKIITTYKIPYIRELKEVVATIVTYFDTITEILFYEVPREFSYESKEQASVAITTKDNQDYNGKIAIPESWYSFVAVQVNQKEQKE